MCVFIFSMYMYDSIMFQNFCSNIRSSLDNIFTKILRLMNHTGIARFCGVFTDLPDLNIILECVVGMSFHDLCHADKNKPLSEAEVKGLSLQLSDVMCYVHSLQVVHRDLKPTNVLVSSTGKLLYYCCFYH